MRLGRTQRWSRFNSSRSCGLSVCSPTSRPASALAKLLPRAAGSPPPFGPTRSLVKVKRQSCRVFDQLKEPPPTPAATGSRFILVLSGFSANCVVYGICSDVRSVGGRKKKKKHSDFYSVVCVCMCVHSY